MLYEVSICIHTAFLGFHDVFILCVCARGTTGAMPCSLFVDISARAPNIIEFKSQSIKSRLLFGLRALGVRD